MTPEQVKELIIRRVELGEPLRRGNAKCCVLAHLGQEHGGYGYYHVANADTFAGISSDDLGKLEWGFEKANSNPHNNNPWYQAGVELQEWETEYGITERQSVS